MNLKFLVAHAGCLTVRLRERSTVRLTGSLFLTVRVRERSTVRLTVRQSVRKCVRHNKIKAYFDIFVAHFGRNKNYFIKISPVLA